MTTRRRAPENSNSTAATGSLGQRAVSRGRREMRETMEAIAVAFILAFLFRTFEAEAFVIPTGSMAPTLFGRHKDLDCPQCGYHFQVGASEEVDPHAGYLLPSNRIETASCPNCRFPVNVHDAPVFTGDRILVNKFPYEFGDPDRWDVFVFKYPEDPKTNYIKRLVGLPGETIEIRQGDLYLRGSDGTSQILRKDDPGKQRELQILVYNNDFPEQLLHGQNWPERWAPMAPSAPNGVSGWSDTGTGWEPQSGRSFEIPVNAAGDEPHWIRYRHIVPTVEDWTLALEALESGGLAPLDPRPTLISDFCAYNETSGVYPRGYADLNGDAYWVGDLTVTFQIDVTDVRTGSEVLVELVEGDRRYRLNVELETGEATISHNDALDPSGETWTVLATAPTDLHGTGSHTVSFANVDDRLVAWIDGDVVPFGEAAGYAAHRSYGDGIQRPGELDLMPVGIAARQVGARVSHLLVERDIYYRADQLNPRFEFKPETTQNDTYHEADDHGKLHRLLGQPEAWYVAYRDSRRGDVLFELGPDEFLALGDNSPRSKDSRLWSNVRGDIHRHAVPRSALVGKAFFIYWPHGVPFLNDGEGFAVGYHRTPDGQKTDYPSFRVPFYPNVERMRRIR